jgi:uncharacterized protein (DUF488 family)
VRIFTVGHSNRAWVEFAALLAVHEIDLVADVRAFPASRRHPQFDRLQLERELPAVGIDYLWLGRELGGMRDYAAHMRTPLFEEGVARLLESARDRRLACMCAEKVPDHCHRNFLSDALVARGIEVVHLIDKQTRVPHVAGEAPDEDRQIPLF